jgi:hypothetical protein
MVFSLPRPPRILISGGQKASETRMQQTPLLLAR